MTLLVALLLIAAQEPSTADLIRRLDGDDIAVRDQAEIELAKRVMALAEVEAALSKADGQELKTRLTRVLRKLKLADLLAKIPTQFSESFRAAAPDLIERLKKAEPGDLIEAIAATCGKATHWETEDKPASHGTYKVQRQIVREVMKGVTRADAAEIILLALRAAPEGSIEAPWSAVRGSALQAIKPDEGADRRRLIRELLVDRQQPQVRQILTILVSRCYEPEDMPALLLALDLPDLDFPKRAAETLIYANSGSYAAEFEKRLTVLKPPLRQWLLHPLRRSGDPKFLKTFEEYLHSPEGDERSICLDAIRKLAPETLPAHYMKWIRSGDPGRIKAGFQYWVGFPNAPGPAPSEELLAEARKLFDSTADDHLRGMAFQVLKRGPADKFRELVLQILAGGRPHMHGYGLHAAREMEGDDVRKALEKLADGAHEMSALEATAILLTKPNPPSLDRVRAGLKSVDPKVRSRAIYIFAQHAREKSRDDLVPMLDDPDPKVQRDALQNLSWQAKGLEERIRKFLDSKDEYFVLAATRILAGLGDKSCLPAIRKGMKTYQREEYLPCLIHLYEPTWSAILATSFKIPDKDATVKDVIDGVRAAFKEKSIEVQVEFPDLKLGQKFFTPGISPKGWPLGWVRTMIMGSDYFFDGKTLFILPRAEAGKRWAAWAEGK